MPKQQMITASRGSLSYCGTPERKMFGSTSVLRTGQGDHVFVMTQLLLHSYPHTHSCTWTTWWSPVQHKWAGLEEWRCHNPDVNWQQTKRFKLLAKVHPLAMDVFNALQWLSAVLRSSHTKFQHIPSKSKTLSAAIVNLASRKER